MARAAKSTKTRTNTVVKEVTDRFNSSWSLNKQQHPRWTRNYKLYNSKRTDRSYDGITDTFVPMVYSTVETLVAALGAGKPSTDFVPQDMYKYVQSYVETGKQPDLKALNAAYDYYWDCDGWDLKSIKTIRGGFMYGTATEWLYWDGDKPRLINLPVRDAIIDPNLTDPQQLWTNPKDYFSGRRYKTTKDALKAEKIVDPETGALKPRFKNVDSITPGSTGSEQLDKELKEQMFLGFTGDNSESVEVLEIWDGDKIRSVANRTVEIEDRDNVLGIHVLGIHRFIADESLIHGKSIIDPIAKPQEYLNDMSNQTLDAVTDILLPERELDPTYADYLDKIESGAPGTIYPFPAGTLSVIQKGSVSPQAFTERQNIKNEIREATGADQIVQGVQASGDTTATEIQAQLNQAGQRFELYVRMFEQEALKQRARIVYRMMLQYINEPTLIPTMTMDGAKFRQLDPSQYSDDYEPKVQLEASVKNAKAKGANQATEAYSILIQDPSNDLWEAKKVLYPKMFDLSEEELDRIIGAEKPEPGMPGSGAAEEPPLAQATAPEMMVDPALGVAA